MYSSVSPPDQKQENKVPDGVSETNWKKFQALKERRQMICKNNPKKGRKRFRSKAAVESELQSEVDLPTASGHREKSGITNKKTENEEKWKELKQYFPHASDLDATSSHCKNYEKEINNAIEKGDFKAAESLSEQLVTQDFVNKAAIAIKSRDFDKKRKAQEQQKTEKRKKRKLRWGFEQKQRWESKGNM